MSSRISKVFADTRSRGRPAFVGYMTCGYPTQDATVELLLALERGGVDIIEVGVPFTDPIAEGMVIQQSHQVSLNAGTDSLDKILKIVTAARKAGLKVPVVLMGYYNPFLVFGETKLMDACATAGVDGFIIVDLPQEEALNFRNQCAVKGLSNIPLIAPTTTLERMEQLARVADSFIYIVSVNGVTGVRSETSTELPTMLKNVRSVTDLPLAIGFGVGTREQFEKVSSLGDGVVVGSAIIKAVDIKATLSAQSAAVTRTCQDLCGRSSADVIETGERIEVIKAPIQQSEEEKKVADTQRFGEYGGRYVPETLVHALDELTECYEKAKKDPSFQSEFESFFEYVGRPSRLHLADHLTEKLGGARIWLKREDLNHTGAHKINNAIGQAILAKRLGKKRIIAETGAGQHGVATATVCAKFGLECIVYMGAKDVERQALNVFRMRLMGATVVPVESGGKTLKDAINEAMRDWVTNISTSHYLIGSAIGPHPFPTIVRDLQSVIGSESRRQMMEAAGKLPNKVLACVGGGSNAIGMFYPFVNDKDVELIGVEAAGEGLDTPLHSATLSAGSPGVLHGTRTYLLQSTHGQIEETHSICAGLDYPGVGPEHAYLKDTKRATYVSVTDAEALCGFSALAVYEGILPALETAHAVYHAIDIAKRLPKDHDILICLSGRGDKDVDQLYREYKDRLPKARKDANELVEGHSNGQC